MKNLLLIGILLIASATQAKTKYETAEFFLKFELAEDGETIFITNGSISLSEGDSGVIYSINHQLDDVNEDFLGIGVIENPDQGTSIMKAYFLYEADKKDFFEKGEALLRINIEIPKLRYRSIFFELTQRNVFMIDVEETKRFYDTWNILEDDNKAIENSILESILDDIKFTASEMRNQMESPMIEEGPYAGTDLFTVMEKSALNDLMEFLTYISARPRIYMGGEWKVSEIYATWLFAGAPMVVKE